MPSDLLNKILDIYDSGKIIPKHLRQSSKTANSEHETAKLVVPSSSSSSSSVTLPAGLLVSSNKPVNDSIYEDIDDKYDPLATSSLSLSTTTAVVRRKIKKRKKEPENVAVIFSDDDDNEDEMYEETDEAEESTTAKESPSSSLKGLFHNIRHSAIQLPSSTSSSSSAIFDGNIFKVPNLPSSFQKEGAATTLKTKEKAKVKTDLLSHYGVDHSSTSFSLSSSSSSGKEGKQVINRDVFSSTIDNVVSADDLLNKKVGDVFGLKGEYEEFMEGGDVVVSIFFFFKLAFHVFVIFWF
jgi:hypothetical protein